MAAGLFPLECATPGVTSISGRFRPNSTSAVDNTLNQGASFTATRTDVGKFSVVLGTGCNSIIAITPGLQLNTAANQHVQILGAVTASTGTFYLQVYESGTGAADIASNANNWIHFTVWFSNRSF